METVSLKIGGKLYSGWKAVTVERDITCLSGAFPIEHTEPWPGQPEKWEIEPGGACQLLLNGEPVVTGYIDSSDREISASEYRINVRGRDKTGDLVDCAAMLPPPASPFGTFRNITLPQLAEKLCKPFGITVQDDVGLTERIREGTVDPGESVHEVLSRHASMFAVLITSDGLGGIVFTRGGAQRNETALVLGGEEGNILSASLSLDNRDRFSRYIALTQFAGDDFFGPEYATLPRGEAEDHRVKRYRPTVYIADKPDSLRTIQDHAAWSKRSSIAKSRRLVVTVVGWSARGRAWRPNELVPVKLPLWGIEDMFLIEKVKNILDRSGMKTELTLCAPGAYELFPSASAESSSWDRFL